MRPATSAALAALGHLEEESAADLRQHPVTLCFRARATEGRFLEETAGCRRPVLFVIFCFDVAIFLLRIAAKLVGGRTSALGAIVAIAWQLLNLAVLYSTLTLLNRRAIKRGDWWQVRAVQEPGRPALPPRWAPGQGTRPRPPHHLPCRRRPCCRACWRPRLRRCSCRRGLRSLPTTTCTQRSSSSAPARCCSCAGRSARPRSRRPSRSRLRRAWGSCRARRRSAPSALCTWRWRGQRARCWPSCRTPAAGARSRGARSRWRHCPRNCTRPKRECRPSAS